MERMYCESAAVDNQQLPTIQQQQKHPQHNSTSPACGQTTTVTLAFKERDLEERFRSWYDDTATAHDAQAASIYLWMVALGSLLYLIIVSYSPSSRPANVDKCTLLIICSWLGPSAHLLLLRLLPRATYVRHRTHIILAMRTFYIAATSVNGFGLCGVGPLQEKKHALAVAFHTHSAASSVMDAAAAAAAATLGGPDAVFGVYPEALGGGGGGDSLNSARSIASSIGSSVLGSSSSSGARCPAESPFSAMLWRSGVIGLIWWGCAFPLPFSTHVPMQAASTALYIATLAPTVCSTMYGVRSGAAVLQVIRTVGDTLAGQLLAAMGVPRPAAAAAGGGAAAAAGGGCVAVLAYVQVVLGLVLPSYAKYCFEVRKRRSWWQDMQATNSSSSSSSAAASAAALAPEQDSSSSGSNGGSSGGLPSIAKLEAAAVAAMAAAKGGWDWGYGRYCKAPAAAAAAEAAAAALVDEDCGDCFGGEHIGGSSSNSSSSRASSVASRAGSSSSSLLRGGSIVSRDGSSSSSSTSHSGSGSRLVTAGTVQQQGPVAAAAGGDGDIDEAGLLAAVDAWDSSSSSKGGLPPNVTDLFVLLVVMAVAWVLLSQLLQ